MKEGRRQDDRKRKTREMLTLKEEGRREAGHETKRAGSQEERKGEGGGVKYKRRKERKKAGRQEERKEEGEEGKYERRKEGGHERTTAGN